MAEAIRKLFIKLVMFTLFVTQGSAFAAQQIPFTEPAFEAALAAKIPVLLDVTAPWCSTCWAQKPKISKLVDDKRFNKLIVFEIDFDTQKDILKKLKVQNQSTLIAFKNGQEVKRSTGDTSTTGIEALFLSAL